MEEIPYPERQRIWVRVNGLSAWIIGVFRMPLLPQKDPIQWHFRKNHFGH